MRRFVFGGVLVAAFVGVLRADQPPAPKLDGTYKAIALTRGGTDEPADVVAGVTLKITGDELTFTVKGKTYPAKVGLNAKAKPAAIDISPSDGPDKGHTFPGIYKLERGELVIAFTEKGDRPTEFKSEGDVLLVRLKRDEKK